MHKIQTEQIRNRFDFIDLLEFIAMYFVVFYHTTYYSYNFMESPETGRYVAYAGRSLLSTCVPLFFVANGFLLFSKPLTFGHHVKKLVRYVIRTFLWSILTMLALMAIYQVTLTAGEFWDAIHVWKQGWISHLWFMGALIFLYFFFPLYKVTFDNNRKVFCFFAAAMFLGTFGNGMINQILTLAYYIKHVSATRVIGYDYWGRYNPFTGTYDYTHVYFCLGGLLTLTLPKIKRFDRKRITLFSIVGLCIATLALTAWGVYRSKAAGTVWNNVFDGYSTVYTLLNVCCIFLLCLNYHPKNSFASQFVRFIANNTMGIYFLHLILKSLISKLSVYWPALMQWVYDGGYLANLIFSFLLMTVCALLSAGIKKIPLLKILVC